jgi:hypothetical protein
MQVAGVEGDIVIMRILVQEAMAVVAMAHLVDHPAIGQMLLPVRLVL